MVRKVLILGGTGDIGTSIGKYLFRKFNDDVTYLSSKDCDLSEPTSINSFLKQKLQYDVLIHSAAINTVGDFSMFNLPDIEKVMRVNCLSFFEIVKNIKPYWEKNKSGKIVILNSLYGTLSRKGRLPYATSKHALHGMMKTLAIELAPIGVMVNSVSPGFVDTKLTRQNNSPEKIQDLVRGIPIGRLASTNEIAYAVSFLASPENTYITGENLTIDGGFSIGGFQG